jgi:uncharacterized RDD family membrane protein YckC
MADDPSVQSFGEPSQPTTGPVGPGGAPLAEWWKRLVAAIIDGIILGIPSSILGSILFGGLFAASTPTFNPNTGQIEGGSGFFMGFLAAQGALILMNLILSAGYQIYLHTNRGQTVGKMAMKIKVVDMETGELIPYGRAGIRWGVQQALAIFTCGIGGLLDGLWPLWDQKRQALHDKPANTVVIDVG